MGERLIPNPWWLRLERASCFPWMLWQLFWVERDALMAIRVFHHWVWYELPKK